MTSWPDLRVDALFGTGLTRPLSLPEGYILPIDRLAPDDMEHGWDELRRDSPHRVAVDVPSGLCADSGRVLDAELPADLTVTFHRKKVGHRLARGPDTSGKVVCVDIGLEPGDEMYIRPVPPFVDKHGSGIGWTLYKPLVERRSGQHICTAPKIAKSSGHKYDHGHALVLCGGPGKGGAGRMAARGALRIGAGLVTLGCPPAALQENASRVDAVMTRPVRGAEGLAAMLEDGRINALALGPGLGTGEREAALVRVALGGAPSVDERDDGEKNRDALGSTGGLDRRGVTGTEVGGAEGRGFGSGAGTAQEGGGDDAQGKDGARREARRGRRSGRRGSPAPRPCSTATR